MRLPWSALGCGCPTCPPCVSWNTPRFCPTSSTECWKTCNINYHVAHYGNIITRNKAGTNQVTQVRDRLPSPSYWSMASCVCPTKRHPTSIFTKMPKYTNREKRAKTCLFLFSRTQLSYWIYRWGGKNPSSSNTPWMVLSNNWIVWHIRQQTRLVKQTRVKKS